MAGKSSEAEAKHFEKAHFYPRDAPECMCVCVCAGVGVNVCVYVCHHINRAECLLEPILYSLAPATRGGLHYRSESFQPLLLVDLKTRFPASSPVVHST